jgi:NADPH-dependent curcumin reductase CurA
MFARFAVPCLPNKFFCISPSTLSQNSSQRPAFYREMAGWIKSGEVKYCEDVVMGLENAPQALIGLLEGRNFGKLLIKVS